LSDIRTLVREEINDSTNAYNTNRYTNAEIDKYINIIHEDIAILTQTLLTQCTGVLVNGTTEYYLPLNFVAFERVLFEPVDTSKNKVLLKEVNPYDMDVSNSGWFNVKTSTPNSYYKYPSYNQIGFYPCPNASGATIRIWYIKKPNLLVNDTDEIFDSIPILDTFRRALVVGTAALLFMQEENQAYSIKIQEYGGYIGNISRSYDIMPNYNPPAKIYNKGQ
jgi:hypothetical protein